MNRKILSVVLSLLLLSIFILPGCQDEINTPQTTDEISSLDKPTSVFSGEQFVPNELLVKFKAGVSTDKKNAALNRISGIVKERILTKVMQNFGDREGWYLIKSPKSTPEAINSMKNSIDVETAEPNFIYNHFVNSNDTYYSNGSLWGMYGNQTTPSNSYGSQAGERYPTTGNTVYVGIIDEGVFYSHEDLNGQVGNPGETKDGIDNDGNGYIDDVQGWDFDGNNNTVYDGTQDDHGTHVAGTIGAIGNNAKGVAGVCWSVKMIDAKFLGRNGGTTANAIKAVDYMTDLKKNRGVNIVAINNSWGGGGYSQALYDAIQRANNAGILFVVAAGNGGSDGIGDNNDATPSYPSSYNNSNIISVASITSSGAKSSFSNYGATTVDLGAPGSGIYSTLPGKQNRSSYGSYSGTSMATPHVTGAAALYYMRHGGDAATIKAAILNSTQKISALSGKCVSGGTLDVSTF
ncbi:MAG: S8 family peptidase [Syntrophothermus sp.]